MYYACFYLTPLGVRYSFYLLTWCDNTLLVLVLSLDPMYIVSSEHCHNGSSNIYKIADNAINNIERPSYLCKETSNQGTLPSVYNQTLCGYEKTQL